MLHFVSAIPGVVWPAIPSPPGATLLSLQAQFEASQWWPPERLRAEQLRQLRLLLVHAHEHVPFYRARFEQAAFDPRAGVRWDDFCKLPLLTRDDLQVHRDGLFTRKPLPSHGRLIEGRTSGSTGKPVQYVGTEAAATFVFAVSLRDHLWHRRDLGAKQAVIRPEFADGHSAGWDNWLRGALYSGPGATLNIRTPIDGQARWLKKHNPVYLVSFPSNIEALARHFLERGLALPRLKQVNTLSEVLKPGLRELCREAWGATLTDLYSAKEAGTIALQCPESTRYHVQSEDLLVEILDARGEACRPGEPGRVVLTTLHNFAMPLIRYEIGDYAVPGEACPCGRGLPVIERIMGRSRNLVTLPDGSRHWPSFPSAMWLEIAPIRQFRLTQATLHDIDVELVAARALTPGEGDRLAQALQQSLGYPFNIRLAQVEGIARAANSKFEDFVSLLAESP